ncbi:hypothetical protein [Pelodictyon phaeoclathratiforme]|jgi:hypothetical protein|uniref:Uncharacterized protein n=1 Tax=Pelodictyon phaeoclathratiforme (strain DSM 5477 / BU-1) TaxID=324925 RepID=B4SCM6_PELPB|nr:hypothetical protein [Pelodictyon phaeoclathratiforme]ACF44231.1 hypothetical protein Ppha_2020 [Pelodictyon phaeoclathratiforme BU-1]MBV5290030.1 hypothetical protein [Pelodictyon phaeoclathratiforme]
MKQKNKAENLMEEIKKIIIKTEFNGKDINAFKESVYKKIEEIFSKQVIIDKKISESAKQI